MTPQMNDEVIRAMVKDYLNHEMLEACNYRLVHGERPDDQPAQPRRSLWSYVFFWRNARSHA